MKTKWHLFILSSAGSLPYGNEQSQSTSLLKWWKEANNCSLSNPHNLLEALKVQRVVGPSHSQNEGSIFSSYVGRFGVSSPSHCLSLPGSPRRVGAWNKHLPALFPSFLPEGTRLKCAEASEKKWSRKRRCGTYLQYMAPVYRRPISFPHREKYEFLKKGLGTHLCFQTMHLLLQWLWGRDHFCS